MPLIGSNPPNDATGSGIPIGGVHDIGEGAVVRTTFRLLFVFVGGVGGGGVTEGSGVGGCGGGVVGFELGTPPPRA